MVELFKMLCFKPHSQEQWDYCRSQTRFNIPTCGRRWGKSIATGHRVTYKLFLPDGYNWIVGPTYKLGEKEFRVVYRDIQKLESLGLRRVRKTYSAKQGDMSIRLPWNTVLEVVSAEKQDSLVGEGLTHAVMSESAQHHMSTWEQYIEPALSDMLGSADFPSTPRGYNWYYGMWLLGQQPENSHMYKSWRLPTWTNTLRYPGGIDNPELQRIRKIVSTQFWKQEYAAEFTTVVGEIYEDFERNHHVTSIAYNPAWENYRAFDFGFDNPTVCLDIMVDPMENVYVWREFYNRYTSSLENALLVSQRENPPGYHVECNFGDPRGADEIAIMAPILGHFEANPLGWKLGIEAVRRFLKLQEDGFPRLFIDPSCVNLISELEQLHVKHGKEGTDINEFSSDGNIQHKHNDHGPDALRYFFNERFVLGGEHFADVYEPFERSEANEFLKLNAHMALDNFSMDKVLY